MILKHFEEEEKLPISSWHHVFHSVESQLPASLAQAGLSIHRVAEPKSQFRISHKRVERRRDVQELLHWCKKRIRPNHENSSFLCVQRRSSTPLRPGVSWAVHIPVGLGARLASTAESPVLTVSGTALERLTVILQVHKKQV